MDTEERKRIGSRIARARRESGLTQRELAEQLGITTRSVQSYEAGAIVPWRHLRRIELVTQKRSGWLLHEEDGREGAVSARTITELLATMEEHQALLREQLRLLQENISQLTRRRDDRSRANVGRDRG